MIDVSSNEHVIFPLPKSSMPSSSVFESAVLSWWDLDFFLKKRKFQNRDR